MIDELFDGLCVYVVRSGTIALLRPETEEKNPMEVVAPGSIVGLRAAINGDLQLDGKGIDGFRTGIYQLRRVLEALASKPALWRAAMRIMSQEVARMRSSIAEHCIHIAE